jgi:hypothetical protein
MACGGTSTSPTPDSAVTLALTDFVTGIQSTGGAVAVRSTGAPAVANGGPAVTVTLPGATAPYTVSSGGSSLVHLQAVSPFSVVFLSVIGGGVDGFYSLTLPAVTADAFVIVVFGPSIPSASFQAAFSVRTPEGLTGPATTLPVTTRPAASSAQIELALEVNPVPAKTFQSSIQWPFVLVLHETNGIGFGLTKITFQETLMGEGVCSVTGSLNTHPNPAAVFSACGHSGLRVDANGYACSAGLYGAAARECGAGGFIDWTVSGIDDRGNVVTAAARVTFSPR